MAAIPDAEEIRSIIREEIQRALRGSASDEAVTIAEAALRLKVSTRSVQRWIRSGELPAVKLGGAVRVPLSAVLGKTG